MKDKVVVECDGKIYAESMDVLNSRFNANGEFDKHANMSICEFAGMEESTENRKQLESDEQVMELYKEFKDRNKDSYHFLSTSFAKSIVLELNEGRHIKYENRLTPHEQEFVDRKEKEEVDEILKGLKR